MYFKSYSLSVMLNRYDKIIIYGTGKYAHDIYPVLSERGLKDRIYCFTQTGEGDLRAIDGIPVVSIQELELNKQECVVLIATSEVYAGQIKQTLSQYGYPNIIALADYEEYYVRTEEAFVQLNTFEECADFLTDWYVETHPISQDRTEIVSDILNRGKSGSENRDPKLIVMICGHISIRTTKIIKALKRESYRIVMLNYCRTEELWCLDELQETGVTVTKCRCIEEMMYLALQYKPLIYFFEPRWSDSLWAKLMFQYKNYLGKMVIALYDVMNDGFAGLPESSFDTERYALEHADGIVWRWYSKDYLESRGFRFQGKSIQFLDYCAHTDMDPIIPDADYEILKLCEVTGVGDEFVEKKYDSEYIEFARVGEVLEKIGNREDCVFHFYAGRLRKENIEKCVQYEKQYNNFKFFLNTEHNELIKRLRDYDFACDLYRAGEWPSDDMIVGRYRGSIRRNSVRNIFFDYLSAGLPIITTAPKKFLEYLEQYGVIIRMNLSSLDIEYLKKHGKTYKLNVSDARNQLHIENQIQRLIAFFKEVAEDGQNAVE